MSDLRRISLLADYRAQLVAMFPRATWPQMMRFDELVATDRIVTDDGNPHPALEAWVLSVIGKEPPEAVLAGLPPAPRPVPGSNALEVAR